AVPFTTISTNLVSGGNGPNIVPADAEFLFDYRYLPGFDPDSIMRELHALADELTNAMRAIDPAAGIEFIHVNSIPALVEARDSAVFGLALGLLDDKTIDKAAIGTEAGFFHGYGVPSIVCGPGSVEQAHKADEFVALDQLAACDRFISGVVRHLSGAQS